MPVRKFTISVDDELLTEFERVTKATGSSRSEAIARSMRATIRQEKVRHAVKLALAASGGPTTREEKARARRSLGLSESASND
jgi:metal-responsive CopG/Arc/MetJ family transcriptional regulator